MIKRPPFAQFRRSSIACGQAIFNCIAHRFLPRVIDYMQRSCNVLDRVYRRYRVRQTYPVYGSQVAMALPRPPG